ncbi:SHOCT domain-containing protein [Streptomyces sp. NPDC020965]|uniref:SHOCT domain-containing protein n=1 Tax=Streptomyces sp. NPDC020965 TaxID=3365105 RepID=UPI00379415BF
MNTLAYGDGSGPGPWIPLFPLIWAAVTVGAIALLRRTRGRRGRHDVPRAGIRPDHAVPGAPGENSPIALLGRRFAAGEVDEEEYWRRLSVLEERFGRVGQGDGR